MSAIEYLHCSDVSHRDLKPENILIGSNKNIKLGDFGFSNLTRDGKSLVTSCGSPNYAAPELINDSPYCGKAVDIWSCGVILYACLTGTLPFDKENIAALFEQISKGCYYMPPFLSEEAT